MPHVTTPPTRSPIQGGVSIGVKQQTGKRNAPALMNTHLWDSFFWDGRAASLKQQAAMPVEDPVEMAHNTRIIARQVAQYPDYRDLLAPLTRTPQDISWELLAESLAEFQRTLMDDPKTQPLDSFLLAIEAGDWQEAKKHSQTNNCKAYTCFVPKPVASSVITDRYCRTNAFIIPGCTILEGNLKISDATRSQVRIKTWARSEHPRCVI